MSNPRAYDAVTAVEAYAMSNSYLLAMIKASNTAGRFYGPLVQ